MDHPVFRKFACWEGDVEPGMTPNFLGVKTRESYLPAWMPQHAERRYVVTGYPEFNEEYFEWIDVLEAVTSARRRFTMIELGAGWGHWLVNAAAALRQTNDLPCCLIGVEAEPTHFRWMAEHFRANGLDPAEHRLIEAAVSDREGDVWFQTGLPLDPASWYSQSIATPFQVFRRTLRGWFQGRRKATSFRKARAVSLNALLRPQDKVDLIHVDIQGAEGGALKAAAEELNRKVKRVFIGTHSPANETCLRRLFIGLGWSCLNDYPCFQESRTPWGTLRLVDGIQSWINPRLKEKDA